MIKKGIFLASILSSALIVGAMGSTQVFADVLEISPLTYKDTVKGSPRKTGFVDIRNPGATGVEVQMNVQAFRQINDEGYLEFYDNPLVTAGITPEFETFSLEPAESIKLFFEIDTGKLPKKQIFAALLANTVVQEGSITGVNSSARVGTLLILDNGGTEVKVGEFTDANIPFFQLGDDINGSVSFKNTGEGEAATAYYPEMTLDARFFGPTAKFTGKLVFPGITRTTNFGIKGDYIGIYRVNVVSGDQGISRPVIVVSGWWRIVVPVVIAVLMAGVIFYVRSRRKHNRHHKHAT